MADITISTNASLFLEDFVVTQLLRKGRSLKNAELVGAAQDFYLSRGALNEGLEENALIIPDGREWNLLFRFSKMNLSKEERERQPIEATIDEVLQTFGKPLPAPVIAREVGIVRESWRPEMKRLVEGALQSSRHAQEVAPGIFLHTKYMLDLDHARTSDAEEQYIIAENNLDKLPKWQELVSLSFDNPDDFTQNAQQILRAAQAPLSRKALVFLLWRQHPEPFEQEKVLLALADRSQFHSLTRGLIASAEQMATWRKSFTDWARSLSSAALANIDVKKILRKSANAANTDDAHDFDMDEIKAFARATHDAVDVSIVLLEGLDIEAEDPQFVPTLVAVNNALRRDRDFLSAGLGRFLLREIVPDGVMDIPDGLRPIQLSSVSRDSGEPMDFEMSDEGLEGDAAQFVHAPQWADITEEIEVRPTAGKAEQTQISCVILPHHYRAGTIKFRREDESFFGIPDAIARLSIQTPQGEMEAWASRQNGIISGLGEWFRPQVPISGGTIVFENKDGILHASIGENDPLTTIDEERATQLEHLRDAAEYMSLLEILQHIMGAHPDGAELPTLWAEANLVRRTAKRLLVSVLCGHYCFHFKQRGADVFLWQLEEGRIDQGVKRNKRRFIRR